MASASRRFRRIGIVLGVFVGLLGMAAVGSAAAAAAPASGTAPVMVILDASGSMTTSDAPGPRIAAAKEAVDGFVDQLPADAQVGLEVYGTSTSSADSEKAAGCRDIKILDPVGPVDKTAFTRTVAGIQARGYTPIGNALRKAAAALPKEGARSIVLVSDGEDTCAPPDPCTVARQLHAQGIGLSIDTVGFRVDAAARQQLQCIADATGGVYRDAPDGPSLAQRLNTQVQRALRGYQTVGTPISGSANPADGPTLQPGQYVDTFANAASSAASNDGTTKYYAITLLKGETPYVSATIVPPTRPESGPGPGSLLMVQDAIESPDDPSCEVDGNDGNQAIGGKVPPTTAVAAPGEVGTSATCLKPGPAVVRVTRNGPAYGDEPLKIEIAYRAEPPADTTGLPGPASKEPVAHVNATGAAVPIDSGTSFNDAPLLTPGVYRDSFVSGETRFVKVHVDWGQRLAYSITPTPLPGVGLLSGVAGYTYIANPVRQTLTDPDGASSEDPFMGSDGITVFSSMPAPARYSNRTSTDAWVTPCSLAGDYYIELSTGFASPSFTDPYVLKISVLGAATPGPRYEPLVSPSPSSSPSAGSSTSPSTSTSPSVSPSTAVAGLGSGGGGGGTPVGLIVGGSAAAVACAVALGALAVRRRRRTQTYPTWPPGS